MYKKLFTIFIALSVFSSIKWICCKKQKHSLRTSKKWTKTPHARTFEHLMLTGPSQLDNKEIKKAILVGLSTINESIIDDLTVTGNLTACNSIFSITVATGTMNFDQCTINNQLRGTGAFNSENSRFKLVFITGNFQAYDSTFDSITIVANDTALFENSNAHSLLVAKNGNDKQNTVTIYLKGKSNIDTIEFEEGINGTVILENTNSTVSNIKNGKIKKLHKN